MTTLEEARNQFTQLTVDFSPTTCHIYSLGERGALIGALNKELRGDENRKLFLKALTGFSSSKDLGDPEWYALAAMTGFNALEKWSLSVEGAELAQRVLAAYVEETGNAAGQIGMF